MLASPPFANRLRAFTRFARRWTLGSNAKEQIARWQALAEHGDQLAALQASSGWTALQERKAVFQRLRDLVMHSASATAEAKQLACAEWNAIDAFFREITQAIRESQKAREALSKVAECAENMRGVDGSTR